MPDHQIKVGNVEFISLSDGAPSRSPLMPFPDTAIEQWKEFAGLVDEQDQVRTRYGTLAVRSSGKLIIIDTGLQAEDGTLMDDMSQKGIDRGDYHFIRIHKDDLETFHRRVNAYKVDASWGRAKEAEHYLDM